MATRTRLATSARLLTPLVLMGTLAGCGPDPAAPAGNDAQSPVAAESDAPSDPSQEPSQEPTEETSKSAEPMDEPGGTGPLTAALLPADQLPGFNQEFTWEEAATENSEPKQLAGTCHQFEMTSIGAEEVAYRTYQPHAGDNSTASELVAQFPDEMTARRAFQVLKSWREKCGGNLKKFDRSEVGPLEAVDTEAGEGHWYLLTYGPVEGDPDSAHFDAQGLVKVGDRIAVVQLDLVGQDYNYDVGQEPMVGAVRAASERLG